MSVSSPNPRLGHFVKTSAASETVRAFVPPPSPSTCIASGRSHIGGAWPELPRDHSDPAIAHLSQLT